MYLTHFSTHQRQYPVMQRQHLMHLLSGFAFLTCLAYHSKMSLIIWQIAMMQEPKAMEPWWYTASHQIDLQMFPLPPVSDLTVKYQMQAEQAITNCWHPFRKLLTQRRAKTWRIRMYRVYSVHMISVRKLKIPSL